MSGHPLDDLPTLRGFRDQLTALAVAEAAGADARHETPRARRRRRSATRAPAPRRLSLVIATATALVIAASAAAATLVGLRAVVIPGPPATDVAPQETVVAASARVLAIAAQDPADGSTWTLRAARTRAGETCLTVGQRRAAGFGLVGLDGRFRLLAPSIVDGCTATRPAGLALIGARTFSARRRADVRTVVYGLGGGLREIQVARDGDRAKTLTATREGAFAAVFAGYPEDHPIRVTLRFADGERVVRSFGASRRLVAGPGHTPALKLDGIMFDNARDVSCLHVSAARHVPGAGSGPTVCGRSTPAQPFGAVRAVRPGEHRGRAEGTRYSWGSFPARTLAWGSWPRTRPRLRSVTLRTPSGTVKARVLSGGRTFLGVLPARIAPGSVTVTMRPRSGAPVTFRGSLNLVPNPAFR